MFIKPCEGRITSPFGPRVHPRTGVKNSFHKGVDIAKPGDVAIHAAADGVVKRVGTLGTYGNIIMLTHRINGKTYETNYAHLKHVPKFKIGDHVKQGDVIAQMGNTGGSTGQHLHFEIHDGLWAKGQPNAVNPMDYIAFSEIKELQEKLNKLGYKLVVDGLNGPATQGAVKLFQRQNKLTVDGNAGPATMKVLDEAVKPKVKGLGKATVKVPQLNLRTGPGVKYPLVPDRDPIKIRETYYVYEIKNGWYNLGGDQWASNSSNKYFDYKPH